MIQQTQGIYPYNEEERYILHSKKENPFAETARDASLRQTTIYLSQFYAMALTD